MSENRTRLTISDIESKQFRRAAYGYEQREVDEFLDCICDEIELMQGEMDDLRSKLDLANAQVRKAEAASGFVRPAAMPDDSFREILETALRVKEQTIADAQKQAEEIVTQAREQADAELGGLQEKHDRLSEALATLRGKARGYRDAMATLIREQQSALDQLALEDEEA